VVQDEDGLHDRGRAVQAAAEFVRTFQVLRWRWRARRWHGSEQGTRRVEQVTVNCGSVAGSVSDRHYDYDEAGNILSIEEIPAVGAVEKQCLRTDTLGRLATAWTPNPNCRAARKLAAVVPCCPRWSRWLDDLIRRLSRRGRLPARIVPARIGHRLRAGTTSLPLEISEEGSSRASKGRRVQVDEPVGDDQRARHELWKPSAARTPASRNGP
jgi:hypothetical protein